MQQIWAYELVRGNKLEKTPMNLSTETYTRMYVCIGICMYVFKHVGVGKLIYYTCTLVWFRTYVVVESRIVSGRLENQRWGEISRNI